MKGYTQVKTQADMDVLIETVSGFNDGLTKEIHIANRGFVDSSRRMHMGFQFDGQILIQSQEQFGAIELLFLGIKHLSATCAGYYEDAEGVIDDLVTIKFDSGLHIKAVELHYRFTPNNVGPKACLLSEIPSDSMAPAISIESGWRQCSVCANAWQEPESLEFSMCPECETITQLEKDEDAEQSS